MTQLFNPHTMETQVDGVRPERATRRPSPTSCRPRTATSGSPSSTGSSTGGLLRHDRPAGVGRRPRRSTRCATRTERCDELNPVIEAWTTSAPTAEIVELATLMRIPCIEVGNGEIDPADGPLRVASRSTTSTPTAASCSRRRRSACTRRSPASVEVRRRRPSGRRSRGRRPDRGRPARRRSAAGGHAPFDGLRVADFTSFWAGPFFAHVLGMFGADVDPRRVDRPPRRRPADEPPPADRRRSGGSARRTSTPPTPTSAASRSTCRAPDGRELARRLVAECDVIVENYSPRVMESFGLSWDDVRAINPGGDHGADAGVRPVRAVARPHRLRHDDGAGVGHGVAVPGSPSTRRARCSGRATRAPGCTR